MCDTSHERTRLGTARFVPAELLDRQGFGRGDFWLGRTLTGKAFGWRDDYSLLTCAGTGAGKGISVVVPNLLQYPGSTIVIDPKGELADLTAAYRRDVLGHKVVVLDPGRSCRMIPDELRGSYNPLACLEKGKDESISRARTIAEGIVTPNPQTLDPFWDDSARDFIQSVILYMTAMNMGPKLRTLSQLRALIGKGDIAAAQHRYPDSERVDLSLPFNAMLETMFEMEDFGGIIGESAAKLARSDKTMGSVLATAGRHLDFLKEPQLWKVTEDHPDPERTFTLADFRKRDRPITLYLCLPADAMHTQGAWLRIIVTQIVQHLQRTPFIAGRDMPVLMLLDEFAQLGKLSWIVNTLNYARGCGLRLWLVVQDLQQLKTNYPDSWQSIMSACGVKQFFGIDEIETAEYISKTLGDTEIEVPSVTISRTRNRTDASGRTTGTSLTKSQATGRSTSRQITVNEGINESWQISHGSGRSDSLQTGSGHSRGTSTGRQAGTSDQKGGSQTRTYGPYGLSPLPSNITTSTGGGTSTGCNTGESRQDSVNEGRTTGTNVSDNTSRGGGRSRGTSISTGETETETVTFGESINESETRTLSVSEGETHSVMVSFKERRLLKPEEIMTGFTAANQLQLVHIRDHGGVLLARSPYFTDPYLKAIIGRYNDGHAPCAQGRALERAELASGPGGMGGAEPPDCRAGSREQPAYVGDRPRRRPPRSAS